MPSKFLILILIIACSLTSRSQDTTLVADDLKIFTKVETDADFPGGLEGWKKYLQTNLSPYTPVDNGAPAGTYQVMVQFIVRKDGSISDVQATTRHGYGMELEVIRIIKNGPNWIPAYQNGKPVNAIRRQPVTFVVSEEKKGRRGRRSREY